MADGEGTSGLGAEPRPPVLARHGVSHRDFLERALISAGEWTRYADAKVVGVLVLLGFGVKDLTDHASVFVHPHHPSLVRVVATVLFAVACVCAGAVVVLVTHALFPRLTLRGLLGIEKDETLPRSRLFFGEISRYGSQTAYSQAVLAQKPHELLCDVAGQVYEVSRIAGRKHVATQRAYIFALLFLIAWAGARIVHAA